MFDWIIPEEWNIKSAYILDLKNNKKYANFNENNLHIVGYSKPINKTITLDELKNAQEEYRQALASGEYEGVAQPGSTADINNFQKEKYGAPLIITDETEINRYNRARDLKAPRSDGKYADEVNKRQPKPIDIGGGIRKIGNKLVNTAGQIVDATGRVLNTPVGQAALTLGTLGVGGPALQTVAQIKKGVDTVNKVKDTVGSIRGAYDDAIDDSLNQAQGITENIDLREENKTGGRVGKAVGGSLDPAARQKQSQLDFLARQPGAQPSQPQPPAVNPQPPLGGIAAPATPVPFDMSKYQGGTFSGGMEDSRNIALNNLARLGVDTSKYSKMTATDTS